MHRSLSTQFTDMLGDRNLEMVESKKMDESPNPLPSIEVFIAYCHEDEELRNELGRHTRLLNRAGLIAEWYDRKIMPGTDWKGQIDERLDRAHVILLLVSAYFLDSDY